LKTQDSLKKRYTSKLTSKLVQFGLGFITLGMVPRALGTEAYGNFGYLTNFFTRTTKFLKFGITAAYYSKLSRRQNEKKLIGFYAYYVVLIMFNVYCFCLYVWCHKNWFSGYNLAWSNRVK